MINVRVLPMPKSSEGVSILAVVFLDEYDRDLLTVTVSKTDETMAVATVQVGGGVERSRLQPGDPMSMLFLHLPPPPEGAGPFVFPPEWLPPSPPDDEER